MYNFVCNCQNLRVSVAPNSLFSTLVLNGLIFLFPEYFDEVEQSVKHIMIKEENISEPIEQPIEEQIEEVVEEQLEESVEEQIEEHVENQEQTKDVTNTAAVNYFYTNTAHAALKLCTQCGKVWFILWKLQFFCRAIFLYTCFSQYLFTVDLNALVIF